MQIESQMLSSNEFLCLSLINIDFEDFTPCMSP